MFSRFDEKDVMPIADSDLTSQAVPYVGWLVTGGVTTWGILLRWALGRYARVFDEIRNDMADLKRDSAEMRVDIANIKGRFIERDAR